jgi:hypothetical protein
MAMIQQGTLRVDERGIPLSTSEYWYTVDKLLLSDMHDNWGTHADKFCVADKLCIALDDNWTHKSELGWVSTEDNSLVYSDNQFVEWREAFEHKQKSRSDDDEGIGKFI